VAGMPDPDDAVEPPWAPLLAELAEARKRMDRVEYEAVALVRAAGATWEASGDALGISRQAARQRFSQPRRRQRPEA
jgi:hypothetical protein